MGAPGNKPAQRPKPPVGHRFEKGRSGNPSGRPKALQPLVDLAREACPLAIRKIIEHLDHDDPDVVQGAAKILLDRGYGKPTQSVDMTLSPGAGFLEVLRAIQAKP